MNFSATISIPFIHFLRSTVYVFRERRHRMLNIEYSEDWNSYSSVNGVKYGTDTGVMYPLLNRTNQFESHHDWFRLASVQVSVRSWMVSEPYLLPRRSFELRDKFLFLTWRSPR